MTGGISCPPVEAAASTAPAKFLCYPSFLIMGMVKLPVPTTLATELTPRRFEPTLPVERRLKCHAGFKEEMSNFYLK